MSKWFGGGIDPYQGSLFFWVGPKFEVLAGIPDKHSVYVRFGDTVGVQTEDDPLRIRRLSDASEET